MTRLILKVYAGKSPDLYGIWVTDYGFCTDYTDSLKLVLQNSKYPKLRFIWNLPALLCPEFVEGSDRSEAEGVEGEFEI